jgi:hypothetical protein
LITVQWRDHTSIQRAGAKDARRSDERKKIKGMLAAYEKGHAKCVAGIIAALQG